MLIAPYWSEVIDLDLPAEYIALFTFQTDLHTTDSIFMGCLSVDWANFQYAYLKLNQYPRNKGQASNGVCAIIAHLLDFVHFVWLLRNKALHGNDTTTLLLSYKHTQLLLEIQELYDQADIMLVADRVLFVHLYGYWLDKPATELTTFLKQICTTVKVSLAQAADMGANFRTIASYYFPPMIPQELFDVILGKPHTPPPVPD
jgi:hypothetical protein